MTAVQNTGTMNKPCCLINVPISDYILTPVACATLINEVMKNLLYQRSQIPYPYAWLQSIVTKKRRSMEETTKTTLTNFTLNKHYQVVSRAYDSAETVMSDIKRIFTCYGDRLKEVIFVIGVTPFTPKEIFTIKVPSLAYGHVERNHVIENSKRQPKILRGIFLENSWMELIEKSLSCSNTYIFLKLSGILDSSIKHDGSVFIPSKPLVFTSNIKHTVINLNYLESAESLCCDNLEIFKDFGDADTSRKLHNVKVKQTAEDNIELWLQSKILIQGFKDCFINKVSACELW